MSKSRHSLHLDRVPLVERMVQNTWRIDHLPPRVLVIRVTNEKVLRRESIRLHIHIGIRDIVDETGLSDVWESGDDKSSRVCIN